MDGLNYCSFCICFLNMIFCKVKFTQTKNEGLTAADDEHSHMKTTVLTMFPLGGTDFKIPVFLFPG